jgi:hypothetical protein
MKPTVRSPCLYVIKCRPCAWIELSPDLPVEQVSQGANMEQVTGIEDLFFRDAS